jgi:hypothetical protein
VHKTARCHLTQAALSQAATGDTGLAIFTAWLAVYAGAMCAAEAILLMRRPPARS